MTPQFECDRCSACCQGTLIVEAYYLDALREPAILHADLGGLRLTKDELSDETRCILLAAGQSCRFLSADGLCTIYPTRPNNCVGMEAGDEQCQEARSQVGLPPLQPLQPGEAHLHENPPTT